MAAPVHVDKLTDWGCTPQNVVPPTKPQGSALYQAAYEVLIEFASKGVLNAELRLAKTEFIARTGELFASDHAFESRLAAFLEWYAFDRPLGFAKDKRPVHLYLEHVAHHIGRDVAQQRIALAQTTLSLFEFVRVKGSGLVVIDLLTHEKIEVDERRRIAGVQAKDIFEGRTVPLEGGTTIFSDTFLFHPRQARPAILRAAKAFRQTAGETAARLALVHRVAYLANRSERYKHVDPSTIFAELG